MLGSKFKDEVPFQHLQTKHCRIYERPWKFCQIGRDFCIAFSKFSINAKRTSEEEERTRSHSHYNHLEVLVMIIVCLLELYNVRGQKCICAIGFLPCKSTIADDECPDCQKTVHQVLNRIPIPDKDDHHQNIK